MSRTWKYNITVWNLDDFSIEEDIYNHVTYGIISADDETEAGIKHRHMYLETDKSFRLETLSKGIDPLNESRPWVKTCRDNGFVDKYVKPKGDPKLEWGTMAVECPGKRNDLDEMYDDVKDGMRLKEVLLKYKGRALKFINALSRMRAIMLGKDRVENDLIEYEEHLKFQHKSILECKVISMCEKSDLVTEVDNNRGISTSENICEEISKDEFMRGTEPEDWKPC